MDPKSAVELESVGEPSKVKLLGNSAAILGRLGPNAGG